MTTGFAPRRTGLWPFVSVLVLLMLTISPVALAAGASTLDVKVQAGYDGKTKVGFWTPVQVELKNAGPAMTAEVIVRYSEGQGSTELVQYVHMPQGSHKRIAMSIPIRDMRRTVDVIVSGGAAPIKASAPLVTTQYTDLFVGVLSSDPNAASHLAALKIPGVPQVHVLTLDVNSIPEDAAALSSLDLLIVSDFDMSALTSAQTDAVKSWVSSGGAALFAGGPSWQKTLAPLHQDLLPVTVSGSERLVAMPSLVAAGGRDFNTTGPFTASRAAVKDISRVVLSEGSVPLIVHGDLGRGRVAYWALDLTLAPLQGWAGNIALWQAEVLRLCPWAGSPAYRDAMSSPGRYEGSMINALRNLPDFFVPAPAVLGGFLLLYIALVGPANYFILRRLRRVELSWITVPLLAMSLTFATYVGNFYTKGRDVFTNTISVVTLQSQGFASARTYVGVFAPAKRSYSLTFDGNPTIVPLSNYYGRYTTGDSGQDQPVTTRVVRQENTRVEFPLTNMWTMQAVQVETGISWHETIDAELFPYAKGIKGRITNRTKYELTDCYLSTAYASQQIGTLKPGQSAEVDMPLSADHSNGYRRPVLMTSSMPPYSSAMGPAEGDRTKMRKQQVLSALFDSDPYAGPRWSLAFTGFCDQPMTKLFNERDALSRRPYLGLLVAPLKVSMQTGTVAFPPGLVKVTGVATSPQGAVKSGPGFYYLPDKGEATFKVELPLPGAQIDSVTLHVPGNSTPRAAGMEGSLYNYRTGKWDRFDVAIGPNDVPDVRDHVSRDGVLQLKIAATGQGIEIRDPTASFQGRVQ